jgi:hypothetical protein
MLSTTKITFLPSLFVFAPVISVKNIDMWKVNPNTLQKMNAKWLQYLTWIFASCKLKNDTKYKMFWYVNDKKYKKIKQ